MLKMYARTPDPQNPNSQGTPVGVVCIAPNKHGNPEIGWSQCSPHDRFTKQRGTMIAVNRLNHNIEATNNSDKEVYSQEIVRNDLSQELRETITNALKEYYMKPKRYAK